MLKQKLSQKMIQKLSPQQIQLMKLLQIPTVSLEQRIKEELEANPALDEGDTREEENYEAADDLDGENQETEFELDDYLNEYIEDDPSSYKMSLPSSSQEEDKSYPVAVQSSFHEYLKTQLGMLELEDEKELKIAKQIIGSIDDDGYLRREAAAIMDDLLFSQNMEVEEEEILEILEKVQEFDPPGVGARSLQECLLLQLRAKKGAPGADLHAEELAETILADYFNEFTKKHYQKLIKQLDITEEELKDAIGEILKLNPKPSSGHSGGQGQSNNQYIIPDFIIQNRDGELELTLNSRNAPELRINDQYMDMLSSYKEAKKKGKTKKKDKEVVLFVKQKIDSAKWFIDAIKQRQDTLYRCMYAILQFQYDYFMTGDQRKLKPMILKDIAMITGLDISTVSRVANSKFVQTEFGNILLKDLFSESLQTQDGEEVSTLQVKKILTDVIAQEDKKKPLSDEKLKNILKEKGYNIARRTIAKYREQLNIPVARLRKEL
ncbi:MAG: RNA polymerase factor sigma-54 [Saprospiraceae bacterium]|nr:RNA polymerase factor sigma-54 [Saprospiraceae bacterium]